MLHETIDINNLHHQQAIFKLMNAYMMDKMGCEQALEEDLFKKIIEGLKKQNNYLGILIKKDKQYIGLANCFFNFSTFKAKPLLNIHDFIVISHERGKGAGRFLMQSVKKVAKEANCCKITLEVRYDNPVAQNLYKSEEFKECDPPMYFWQADL